MASPEAWPDQRSTRMTHVPPTADAGLDGGAWPWPAETEAESDTRAVPGEPYMPPPRAPNSEQPRPPHGVPRAYSTHTGVRAARSPHEQAEFAEERDGDVYLAPSDAALLQAHLRGDPHGFAEIERRHRTYLWVVALRVLDDHHDAQDAVQIALMQAFRNADRWRGGSDAGPWLRTIVENTSKTLARHRDDGGRQTAVPPGSSDLLRHGTAESPEQIVAARAELAEALATIPEPFRHTFVLVKLRGLSYAEAAEVENVTVGTVRSRINRAKAALAAGRAEPS